MKKIVTLGLALTASALSFAQTIVPDTTFGINGKKTFTFFNNIDRSFGSVAQADNKMVIVGLSKNTATSYFELCFARFFPSGIIDSSFGTNGITKVAMGNQQSIGGMTPKLKIAPDGKFVAVNSGNGGGSQDIFMCRLDSSGMIDPTFNNTGSLFVDMTGTNSYPDIVNAFDFDAAGNIYAVGATRNGGSPLNNDFAVVKVMPNGQLDPSFDTDGKKLFDPTGTAEFGRGLRVQPDGKIVIGGTAGSKMFVFRIDSTGNYDTSFNLTGKVTLSAVGSSSDMYDLLLDDSNKIVVGGVTSSYASIVRLNPNGAYDSTFAGNGRYQVLINGAATTLSALQKDTANSITFTGSVTITGQGLNFYIARVNAGGVIDASFTNGGSYALSIGAGSVDDECEGISLLPDGRYFLNGTVVYSSAVNEDIGMCLLKRVPPTPTGINTVSQVESDWSILGNFVEEKLIVNCKKEITFALLTIDGKMVLTNQTNIGSNTISLNNLPSGMYIITDVSTGKSKQIVKQ
ncbi:MAG: T9SS type A sorting domain-containing protein [Bacteroidota bacterium]